MLPLPECHFLLRATARRTARDRLGGASGSRRERGLTHHPAWPADPGPVEGRSRASTIVIMSG
eukprot:9073567-Pyramimonas_sp.AAC.1